jgi:Tfp pilus assembly protein PilN
MADIDMIPRSYREALRARRTLANYGATLALVLVAGAAGAGWLRWRLAVEAPRLDQLRSASAQADAMRAQVATAQQRKNGLRQASQALAALRGSGALARLSDAVDGALNDRVWFAQLAFSRTQELLRDPLPSPLPDGTVQIQRTGAAAGAVENWRLASHVEITGQAFEHESMTRFLAALAANPALANVRFLSSGAAPADSGATLSFTAGGSLRSQAGVK